MMVDVSHFSFRFKNTGNNVLDDVSLSVKKGEVVLITGPSGCGKSTLALCIAGFSRTLGSFEGTIDVDGKSALTDRVFETASRVGIVQQDPEGQLVALTVEDEVAFGPENLCYAPEEIEMRVEKGLRMAGASHLRNRSTNELSGGEKQKIALASMLAMDPKVLIFDEPTSNLDPVSTREIFDSIVSLKESSDLTIIVIEHKLGPILPYADTLVTMDMGTIHSSGAPEKVLMDGGLKQLGIRIPHTKHHDVAAPSRPTNGDVLIDVEGLCSGYGKKNVLRDLDFRGSEGEMICIMGKNGSGKTTFLQSIMGFVRPSSGKIRIGKDALQSKKTSSRARAVGIVFQNPNHQIFEDTLKKEIEFAPRNFGMDVPDAERMLSDFMLPTNLERSPHSLSFGQKRRLTIASVMAYNPKILILDEPFVGQDYTNATSLMGILEGLQRKDNLIMFVSHDPRMISRYCTRILFFEEGRIKYDGAPADVFGCLLRDGYREFTPRHMGAG